MIFIGNDIVDLDLSFRSNSFNRPGFIAKILNPSEERVLSDFHCSQTLFWVFWAAKEAAFKVAAKMGKIDLFSPKKFLVKKTDSENFSLANSHSNLEVVFYHDRILVEIQIDQDHTCIHAIASLAQENSNKEQAKIFSGQVDLTTLQSIDFPNFPAISSNSKETDLRQESLIVRHLCILHIAAKFNLSFDRLRIIRRRNKKFLGPPQICYDDQICALDLSLSHHGKWVGWAFSSTMNSEME